MSNTSSNCNGHNLGAVVGSAHTTNSGCGNIEQSNVPVVADPYSGLASQIPTNTCGGVYPQEPAKKNDPALPTTNQWSGNASWSGNVILCGDQQLTGNLVVNASGGAVVVIENG